MVMKKALLFCLIISIGATVRGQQPVGAAAKPVIKAPRAPYYIDPSMLNVRVLLMDPPAVGSTKNDAELAELHRIQDQRTPDEVARAKADDAEEDMFIFKTVFGPRFTPEILPITAELGQHVKNEQSVAGSILKHAFQRPRPYQVDGTLHPVCPTKSAHDSYPSGHSLTGYLEALTLIELVPERRDEILARADQYAYDREVCGVHYPSDTEASRRLAYAVFGYMLATPKFQRDLAEAREEIRVKLLSGVK